MAEQITNPQQNESSSGNITSNNTNSSKGLTHAYRGTAQIGNGMPKTREYQGAPSIFNPQYALFRHEGMQGDNKVLFDHKGEPGMVSEKNKYPTIERIMEWQSTHPNTPYRYTDFMYCSNYGYAPNNHLITLRRYPVPIFDNPTGPETQPEVFPIAQAITYFGEDLDNKLDDLLSFSCGLKWRELSSEVHDIDGNEMGDGNQPLSGMAKILGVVNQYTTGKGKNNPGAEKYKQEQARAFAPGGPYSNQVYGPVNRIDRTYVRDAGLEYDHSLKLTFNYNLKSIGNINPKMAMLDLLANIMSIVYNNAKFWGGAVRYWPNKDHVYPFLGDQKKWFAGDPAGYLKSVTDNMSKTTGNLGNFFTQLLQDPKTAISSLLSNGLGSIMGNIQNKGTFPNVIGHKALLTGQPTGEWHVVIGNPLNPIAMIGNLICKDTQFEFNNELGADDFPTKLKVTVTLDHGRPRDAGDIHSMFNLGGGRLYYPYDGQDDILNRSYSSTNHVPDMSDRNGDKDVTSRGKKNVSKETKIEQVIQAAQDGAIKLFDTASRDGEVLATATSRKAHELKDKMGLRDIADYAKDAASSTVNAVKK